ncbi:MAG: GntR family transcriptional regulator, partial [Lentisphaeria bacterium]|nr:GntR family transcriptional regulator [Lentisphaeria bacterium]
FENRLPEGAKLPSERKLCALFETSNLPLRRAEDELCEGGMLRRVKSRGVFVGKNWDRTKYSTRLGLLSVGVNNYPSGPAEEEWRNALREHLCDLQVIRTIGTHVTSAALRELEECDYIIISGFVTPAWIEAVKALEKPCLHIGYTALDTGIPRIENDFADMYATVLKLAEKLGAKRLLCWFSPRNELSYADSMVAGLDQAIADRGFDASRVIRDEIPAHGIRSCLESLRRHRGKFDLLVVRDYVFGTMVYHPEWSKFLGDRPVVVINTSHNFPDDFDRLPNIYRLEFAAPKLPMFLDFFFKSHNRLPGGAAVIKEKAVICPRPDDANYWSE